MTLEARVHTKLGKVLRNCPRHKSNRMTTICTHVTFFITQTRFKKLIQWPTKYMHEKVELTVNDIPLNASLKSKYTSSWRV